MSPTPICNSTSQRSQCVWMQQFRSNFWREFDCKGVKAHLKIFTLARQRQSFVRKRALTPFTIPQSPGGYTDNVIFVITWKSPEDDISSLFQIVPSPSPSCQAPRFLFSSSNGSKDAFSSAVNKFARLSAISSIESTLSSPALSQNIHAVRTRFQYPVRPRL